MKAFLFRILSILLGVLTGAAVIVLFEFVDQRLHPVPAGFNPSDPATMKQLVASMPLGALLMVLAGWAVGTFAGAWVASRVDPAASLRSGITVGCVFLAGAVLNFMAIPHPRWFVAVSLLCFLPAAYLGAKLGAMRRA